MAEGPATLRTTSDSIDSSPFLDVGVILAYVLGCGLLFRWNGTNAVTGAFTLPLALFVPGYCIVAAIYPETGAAGAGVDLVERAALSFGVSLAVLPLVGLGLGVSGVGLTAVPLLVTLAAISVVGLGVSAARRGRLPAGERFRLPVDRGFRRFTTTAFGNSPLHVSVLYVLLAAAVVLAVGMLGGALFFPDSGESYSGLAVVTEDENGSYVAGEYPDRLPANESRSLVAAVTNREGTETEYTLVVQLQRLEYAGGDARVLERTRVTERSRSLAADETWHAEHSVTADRGEDLRIVYLLYRGDAPEDATVDSAYRHADVRVDGPETDAA